MITLSNNTFFLRLNNVQKFTLGILFSTAFVFNTWHRFHHRAELSFHLNFYEWILLISSVSVFLNPKGIKFLVLLVFVYTSSVATKDIFQPARSGLPRGLFFRNLCGDIHLDSGMAYFSHMALYIGSCIFIFVNTQTRKPELLDQE